MPSGAPSHLRRETAQTEVEIRGSDGILESELALLNSAVKAILAGRSPKIFFVMNQRDRHLPITSHIPAAIADVQGMADTREIAIDRVGIKALRHPIRVVGSDGEIKHSVATFDMTVRLAHDVKGTHMSRFVEVLESNRDAFTVHTFGALLKRMVQRLDVTEGRILLLRKISAHFRREIVTGCRGTVDRGNQGGRYYRHHQSNGARHQSLSLLEGNFCLRRAQSAITHQHFRCAPPPR